MKTKYSRFYHLKRLIEILRIISESTGRRVGTKEILEKLQGKQITVSLRTIQRDLHMLHDLGIGIDVDKHSPMGAKINNNNQWLVPILQRATEQ